MDENSLIIRQANFSDIESIANVGYRSWLTTYAGIFPDKYIAQRTPEKRIPHIRKNWKGFEEQSDEYPSRMIYVAQAKTGKIVGFVAGGESFSQEVQYECEMYAFYIIKDYQRKGVGTRLFLTMLDFLKTFNYKTMVIWVLKENPSCRFYEKMGGEPRELRIDEREGNSYELVGYVWNDIYQI